jgi:hypothetical protein
MNVRDRIVSTIQSYHRGHRKYPEVLELSWGAAYDLCKLSAEELGPELFEELFSRGPISLQDETIMGCKVKLTEPIGAIIIKATRKGDKEKPKPKPRRSQRRTQKRRNSRGSSAGRAADL